MKYPLEELLRVRRLREDDATNELTRRRREVEQAERMLEQRQRELEEYTAWRIQREAELYEQVIGKQVPLKALDDLKKDIQILRDQEITYQERILAAEKALAEAKARLVEAQAAYQATRKDRQKIDEHKGIWAAEAAREYEAGQELELEDFKVRAPESNEPEGDENG